MSEQESVNKVRLVGWAAKDGDEKSFQSGHSKGSLKVVTKNSWYKDGERMERSTYHNVIMWGPKSGALAAFREGDYVEVVGRIENRSYEHEGIKRYITEINADSVVLASGNSQSDDDLPF